MTCSKGCCETNREHWASITFAPSAMPTRKREAMAEKKMESQWELDRPAYKRLRKNGLQPPQIKGCAELEKKAATKFEVESGRILSPERQKTHEAALQRAQEYKEATGL